MQKGQKALVLLNSASTSPARPVPCQNPFITAVLAFHAR
jgi:hypothetical protein